MVSADLCKQRLCQYISVCFESLRVELCFFVQARKKRSLISRISGHIVKSGGEGEGSGEVCESGVCGDECGEGGDMNHLE